MFLNDMKKWLKYTVWLLAAAVLATACDFEPFQGEKLSGAITVSPREIELGDTSLGSAQIDVHSTGDWIIVAPDILIVQPLLGSGDGLVSIMVPAEAAASTYTLYVCGTDVTIPVVIRRTRPDGTESI